MLNAWHFLCVEKIINWIKILSSTIFLTENLNFLLVLQSGVYFYHSLEAGMQLHQERRLLGKRQHSLFHHGAVNVIILDDDVLLEDLDGVQLVCTLSLGQHDLKKDRFQYDHFFRRSIDAPFRNFLFPAPSGSWSRSTWSCPSCPCCEALPCRRAPEWVSW